MPRTERWWVCTKCKLPVKKAGKTAGNLFSKGGHRDVCSDATYWLKEIPQAERPKRKAK